jgi:hypothetical protein
VLRTGRGGSTRSRRWPRQADPTAGSGRRHRPRALDQPHLLRAPGRPHRVDHRRGQPRGRLALGPPLVSWSPIAGRSCICALEAGLWDDVGTRRSSAQGAGSGGFGAHGARGRLPPGDQRPDDLLLAAAGPDRPGPRVRPHDARAGGASCRPAQDRRVRGRAGHPPAGSEVLGVVAPPEAVRGHRGDGRRGLPVEAATRVLDVTDSGATPGATVAPRPRRCGTRW